MRGVLPRELAAGVITGAASRMCWTVGAASILLTVPLLIEEFARAGQAGELPAPIAVLLIQLAALLAAARIGRPWAVLAYLAVGAGSVIVFQQLVLASLPEAIADHAFLLNRPTVALVLIGVTAPTTLVGVSWVVIGLGVALGVFGVSSAIQGQIVAPGAGPYFVALIAIVGYLTLAGIQIRLRRQVPNYAELELQAIRLQRGEDLARRTTAIVHDTLLNDLALIMTSPERLNAQQADRLRADLDTLTGADWLITAHAVAPSDDQDAHLRNQITQIISEFQWRGLSVEVTGSGPGIYRLEPRVANALLGALRATFENVLRHAGTANAELDITYADDTIIVMVTDQGVGFDVGTVEHQRLGIRESIVRRIEDVGGRVDVWSTAGVGSSVVLSVPIAEVVSPQPVSTHHQVVDPRFAAPRGRLAPQQIDPLSWFTGPFVPLVFGGLTLFYGVFAAVFSWFDVREDLWVQLVAIGLTVCSHVVVQIASAVRARVGLLTGIISMTLSSAGFIVSAVGYSGTDFRVELWWAPIALAMTMGSLGPYLPARLLVPLGGIATVITTPIAVALVGPEVGVWGPIGSVIVIGYSGVLGVLLAATFSSYVSSRTLRLLERRSQTLLRDEAERDAELVIAERARLAGLTSRAVPFLEDVLARGAIRAIDRSLAGQIARRLRDDLVAQIDSSWLDDAVAGTGIVVLDPDQRAQRLRTPQRAALRGLVTSLLDTPSIDAESVLIELRGGDDGATAVGVSLDMDLPEGRRIVHLRPHVLRLRTAAEDLEWDPDELRLSFRFPSGS